MANSGNNGKGSLPLGCCRPKEERQGASPVFRQQYVNDNGRMRLTMPVSPMHYITSAGYYANDMRLAHMQPPRDPQTAGEQAAHAMVHQFHQQVPQQLQSQLLPQAPPFAAYPQMYDPQEVQKEMRQRMSSGYGQKVESVGSVRSATPNAHLMAKQPNQQLYRMRRESATVRQEPMAVVEPHVHPFEHKREAAVKSEEIASVLKKLEERMSRLTVLCESILEETLSVKAKLGGNPENSAEAEKAVESSERSSRGSVSISGSVSGVECERSQSLVALENLSKEGASSCSFASLPSRSAQQAALCPLTKENSRSENYGSTVFDVSKELRKSNDMLEHFLSGSESMGSEKNAEHFLKHENMQVSVTNQTHKPQKGVMVPVFQKGEMVQAAEQEDSRKVADVVPYVTTASMVQDENNLKATMQHIEKNFQSLMNTFAHGQMAMMREGMQDRVLGQEADERMAIGNGQEERGGLALRGTGASGGDIALVNSGGIAIPGKAGELATREAANGGGEVVVLQDGSTVQAHALENQEQLELADMREAGGAIVVPGEMGVALASQDHKSAIPQKGQLEQLSIEARLSRGSSWRSGGSNEVERLDEEVQSVGSTSQSRTGSMQSDAGSRQASLERIESIGELNETTD
ncbi:calcium channel flower homolog isoform X1, putative [Babesia caballi]|uniref:Calcium channel flower homolog isoform X1, putative n=1 Tax=Babesia caballi TaxID=5871 RepID=A0AAV4LVR3_BABCB|nr:calcium channel flower homolog isoform X1, putative [Babesia caballi]